MSTLKTHNLQSPDAGSVNIALAPNAGMVVTGISTFASNVDIDGNTTFGANGSITSSADFHLSSNSLRVTGGSTVVGEFKGASIPTVQVTQTTNNSDLQLRANSEGGLVRTATNFPLILGAYQKEKLRIDGGSHARIGINTSTFDTAGAQIKIDGRGTGTTSPPYLQIKGVGNGALHSYVDLIATSDNNAGSSYRGLGVLMHDEPTNVEWFAGRPYAGSDKYIIGRKASPSYRTQSGEIANSFFQITSTGVVTKSAHPSFYARRSIGGDGRSSASPVTEWVNPGSETSGSPIHNRGGHFNHTNGLFTAPVNGIYHFSAAAGYKQTNNSFNQKFRMNGVDVAEGCRFVGSPPNSHSTGTISATMYMASGDTMGVTIETTHHVNTTFNYFSGHLVA